MPLSPGLILNNRYRIVKLLGEGGFGAVYQAWDTNLDEPVALKENLRDSSTAQKQFHFEAKLLFKLHHANLPRVHDFFIVPDQGMYLVMDYIAGEDLGSMLHKASCALPEWQVLRWIDQVCDALEYLHAQTPPIIHRDIKPANIKITPQGKAMLVDFGIAKVYDPVRRTTLGASGSTPGYSPFEQYGQEPTDARSDIYSLGATLYSLLTCEVPVESIARVGGKPLVSIRQLNPRIRPDLETAVLRAMEVAPVDRFQSMAELRAALAWKPSLNLATQPDLLVVTLARGVTMEFVRILTGKFLMGSDQKRDSQAYDDEFPIHSVELSDYWIAKTPVTNRQYWAFTQAAGQPVPVHWIPGDREKTIRIPQNLELHPVVNVSWRDAAAFCDWASQVSRQKIVLPSEAQWEKAARGPDGWFCPWGDEPPDSYRCNFRENVGGPTPVGQYSPQSDSPYGCVDMAGNVWEWCADWYAADEYSRRSGDVVVDPQGPPSGKLRVLRGGGWLSNERGVRGARRFRSAPAYWDEFIGFRCARLA